MASAEFDSEFPFTRVVEAARSGLKRDVQALIDALPDAELLIPLARDLPGTPEGEPVELTSDLVLTPHLLPDGDGHLFCALFTRPEPIGPIIAALGWTTEEEELKICSFPARVALQMAHDAIDEKEVFGLVIDAGSDSELCLQRREIGSLLTGHALPLVGYVENIPADERERTLIAEPAEPPPAELVRALEIWIAAHPEVLEQKLERTFNSDRDLEPHLTLTLRVAGDVDRNAVFRSVTSALDGKLPPPGYLDVLFVP